MSKMIKIEKMVLDPGQTVSVVGTKMDGQVNFMTASWFTRLEVEPYLFGVSIQKQHFTHKAIMQNKCFSINIPTIDMIPQADAAGQLSGKEYDKSKLFDVFYGDNENAPMIEGSLVSIECALADSVSLVERDESHPMAHTLFIAGVKGTWANKEGVDENGFDLKTLSPILWTWSPMNYWAIGKKAGQAWNPDSRKLVPKKEQP